MPVVRPVPNNIRKAGQRKTSIEEAPKIGRGVIRNIYKISMSAASTEKNS